MTNPQSLLDDATVERLLAGRSVDGRPELEATTTLLRALGALEADPPAPTGHLAALLAAGFDPADAPAAADDVPVWAPPVPARRDVLRHPAARLAGLSLAAKVLLGGGVAVAGVTSAAGAGVLPDPVQDGISAVVEAVTPFDVPRAEPTGPRLDPEDDGAPAVEPPRPSVPAGPPSARPTAPGERPAAPGERPAVPGERPSAPGERPIAPGRTGPPEQAPEQAGRPTSDPGRTARPEQAPPAPPAADTQPGQEPSRAAEPAPPAQQAPDPAPARQQQLAPAEPAAAPADAPGAAAEALLPPRG